VQFQDIFVVQILGLLIARKFSGIASFVIGKNDNMAGIWFKQGMVVNVHYVDYTDAQALDAIAWEKAGELELKSQNVADNSLENYSRMVEELVNEISPAIIDTCPMLMNACVTRVQLKPLKNSPFRMAALTLLTQISSGSRLTDIPAGNLSKDEFWNGFWYLTSHGLVVISYVESIGVLMQQFEVNLTDKMTKLMGSHIAKAYTKKLWQNIHRQWPDWEKGSDPDPIYGTYPYRLWAQMVQDTLKQVGTPALQTRCFDSALSIMPPQDAKIIHNLLT